MAVSHPPTRGPAPGPLTERHDDGAGDAVGHDDGEDTEHPRVHGSKLVLEGLVLGGGGGEGLRGLVHTNPPLCTPSGRGEHSAGGLWKWEAHRAPHLSRPLLSLHKPPPASPGSHPDLERHNDSCFRSVSLVLILSTQQACEPPKGRGATSDCRMILHRLCQTQHHSAPSSRVSRAKHLTSRWLSLCVCKANSSSAHLTAGSED